MKNNSRFKVQGSKFEIREHTDSRRKFNRRKMRQNLQYFYHSAESVANTGRVADLLAVPLNLLYLKRECDTSASYPLTLNLEF